MKPLSMTHEDYLEAMVMLGGGTGASIRPVDVATKMGVSKPSVSKAVHVLKENGYVEQPYYGEITLTEAGMEYGSKILERHRALTLFLTKAVGLEPDEAEKEACEMEHSINDESFEKWLAFIDSLDLS